MGEEMTRVTKEGRKLTYRLKVIQQPERARACGSGAKCKQIHVTIVLSRSVNCSHHAASSDRRPVDPPPVVELRIFEGEDKSNDVTFAYNANFFLFATLEMARPIIHGRVQNAGTQQVPVLTGMPVSGMAYLDRPQEAGYFIFPDLSIRHEGKYRLSFNLYEETKDLKDTDVEQSNENQAKPSAHAATPNGSFDWRLEIKSSIFTVYSAKKFPGLTESTSLSRIVAEQGCRVRIRRDVRMRRREGKNAAEADEYDEEYTRGRTATTSDSVHDAYTRERSHSGSPVSSPYTSELRRASSGAEYSQSSYPPSYPGPSTGPQSGSSGYLSFGGSSAQQYQTPQFAQPAPPAQPMQARESYQSSQPTNNQPPQYRQSSASGDYAYPERQPYPTQYAPSRENYEMDYRRASVAYAPPPSGPPSNQYQAVDQNYHRNASIAYEQYQHRSQGTDMQPSVNLAPLKMAPLEPKYAALPSPADPLAGTSRMAPALPSPSYQERPSSYGQYSVPGSGQRLPEPTRSGKRTYDSVFSSSSHTQPLYNGMRPTSSHHARDPVTSLDEDDDTESMEPVRMQYNRADGSTYSREQPSLE
jgi:hypothetical protein